MSIFNSLGSNYNFEFVTQAIFSVNNKANNLKLISYLENKYQGKVTLVYKGREAIERALNVLDLPKNSVVAINGFTCFAVYKAIKNAGQDIEYIDTNDLDLNFSAESLKVKLQKNPKIKVVIIQNTLGYPSEIEE